MSRKALAYVAILVVVLAGFSYGTFYYTRKVSGTSMLPTLETGDLVVIEPVSISSIQVGNVVIYSPPCAVSDFSVIHRVVNITTVNGVEGLITKGDNNPQPDQFDHEIANGPVTQNCLVGKVVLVVPYIERLADLPYGVNYILALTIILFVIAYEVYGGQEAPNKDEGAQPAQPRQAEATAGRNRYMP